MPDLSLNGSRRKRSTATSSTSQEGGASFVQTTIALILAVALAIFLIAPNQVDHALSRTTSAVIGKGGGTNQVWSSVVSTFASEDAEREQSADSSLPSPYTVLQHNEQIVTGSVGRIVLTQGHDILEMEPETAIAVDASGPDAATTTIKLIDGTIHVKAAKRSDGRTFSVETPYLVATVKGTKFDVTTTDLGAAVSVVEGLVSVRSAGSSDGVDVTPGTTAVVSAAATAVLTVGPTTPADGVPAMIDAVKAQSASAGAESGASTGNQGDAGH